MSKANVYAYLCGFAIPPFMAGVVSGLISTIRAAPMDKYTQLQLAKAAAGSVTLLNGLFFLHYLSNRAYQELQEDEPQEIRIRIFRGAQSGVFHTLAVSTAVLGALVLWSSWDSLSR